MSRADLPGTQDLLHAALSLAARGWHVFPCVPGRKHPALRVNWQEIATTDPDRIAFWWRQTAYNIGIACGPSGLVVIDLDSADHGTATATCDTPDGRENLASLCIERSKPYPVDTMVVHTPSGCHLYFRAPEERVPNSAGKLAPLVDVRGAGGYVVAPGSRTSRGFYETVRPLKPAPLPSWLADLARQTGAPPARASVPRPVTSDSAYADAAIGHEAENVARATRGTRNDTLFKSARSLGQLAAGGVLSPDDVKTALTPAAEAAGLGRAEIVRTIESGLKSGARRPRGRPRPGSSSGTPGGR